MQFESGGEAACWLHLVCESCGAVLDGSGVHRPGCERNVPLRQVDVPSPRAVLEQGPVVIGTKGAGRDAPG